MNGLDLIWSAMNDDFETFRKFFEECFGEGSEGFSGTKLSGQMLISAIFNRMHETAFFLVNKGANLNCQNEKGETPVNALAYMHFSGRHETDYELMKLMLDKGADLNIRNDDNELPIMRMIDIDKDLFSLMLDYQPELYECRHFCIRLYPDYYQIIKDKGLIEKDESKMDLYGLAENGSLETFKQRFDKSLLREKNEYDDTLMECAIYGRNWEVAKYLLEQGIDINEEVWWCGETLLHAVLESKKKFTEKPSENETSYSQETLDFIKYLLENGADVNAGKHSSLGFSIPNDKKYTNDQIEVFNLLLDYNPIITNEMTEDIEFWHLNIGLDILKKRGFIK